MPDNRPAPDPLLLSLQDALKGRYSIERELGRGGMGVVYLAREVVLDRPVALKVLPPELAAEAEWRDRFLREARTAARLSHPNIVPIHAVGEAGEHVYFAMAYVDGETLGQRVRRDGPLPAAEAARVLTEVAWALGYAHAQGIVHRDVKPENILLEAGTGRAIVTDFGIAAAMASGPEPGVMGTAAFMSPEQAAALPVDGRSDLYSLGLVGHYALSGRVPGEDQDAALVAVPGTVAPGVPAPLTRALGRCLAEDPEARFPDGEALAAALGGAVPAKKGAPSAIRRFLEETQAQGATLAASTGFGAWIAAWTVAGAVLEDLSAWPLVTMGAFGLGFLLSPAAILARKARTLLRSGHQRDEVVRALADEVEDRRRTLDTGASDPSAVDRWLAGLTWGGAATLTGSVAWLGWGPYVDTPLFWAMFSGVGSASTVAFFGAGFASALRDNVTGRVRGQRWLRLWDSRLGRGLFGIAGIGVEPAEPSEPGYRPTAVAIGMAADGLYRALPGPVRGRFPELPEVVAALESDAEAIRARIRSLDDVGSSGELDPLRADAEARLSQVVAALESIRLQLIRMHAGAGSPELLTRHLGDARDLAGSLERLADARRDVDALLGIPEEEEADTPSDTPVPA